MTHFTPTTAIMGGLIIGLGAALLFWSHGKIAGISGILGGLLTGPGGADSRWRAYFLGGMIATGLLVSVLAPSMTEVGLERSTLALVAAGLLVGFGTRLGNGCTSGHGVCGISRLSARSLLATLLFTTAGAVSVYVVQHQLGGKL